MSRIEQLEIALAAQEKLLNTIKDEITAETNKLRLVAEEERNRLKYRLYRAISRRESYIEELTVTRRIGTSTELLSFNAAGVLCISDSGFTLDFHKKQIAIGNISINLANLLNNLDILRGRKLSMEETFHTIILDVSRSKYINTVDNLQYKLVDLSKMFNLCTAGKYRENIKLITLTN